MKLNYPVRFGVTILAIALAAWIWSRDGVDRGLDLKGGASLTYSIDVSTLPPAAREDALLNTVRVIEERINNLGLRDVKVDALPPDRFEVQFPGKEPAEVKRIKDVLVTLGQLEFRIIALPAGERTGLGSPGPETDERRRRDEMGSAYPGPPPGYSWVPLQTPARDQEGKEIKDRLVEVPEAHAQAEVERLQGRRAEFERELAEAGGDATAVAEAERKISEVEKQLERADEDLRGILKKNYFTGSDLDPGALRITQDPQGAGWIVLFATVDARKTDFGDFTAANIKRQMAIIIDGRMESAPVIQSKLPGGGQISGGGMGFDKEEAQDLVTVLRSGSLEVGITLQSEFAIGPSLGEASIRRGFVATAIGFGAVMFFMIATYYFAGVVAIFALLMNLLLIMGALAFLQAQLSLPGIAGVILTVGMAVDANILVFERIREEREAGKGLATAVKAGYDRAFVTIVDANVTTIFTGVVLYFITTGQVRGFAAVLITGILASMFTALYVTRGIFGFLIERGWLTEMRMPKLFGVPKISYMRVRLPLIFISLALILAGIAAFETTGIEKYDIEFAGGQRVVVALKTDVDVKEMKDRIAAHYPDASVVSVKSDRPEAGELDLSRASDSFQITINAASWEAGKAPDEIRQEVLDTLAEEFADVLVPDGVVFEGGDTRSAGVRELRLSFKVQPTEEQVRGLFDATEGVRDVEVLALDGSVATVRAYLESGVDVFRENLDRAFEKSELRLSEPFPEKSFVDPQTAEQHRDDAIKAVLISLVFQILYIYFRFRGASFGFAAVLALVHDVLITLGAIAFFGWTGLVNVKINLPIIAAILTLIGYSMNDTIVVFDRIRENLGRGKRNLSEVIDLSVNQTMGRSLRTSITTFVVVLVLFVVNYGAASSVLEGFAFVLMVGVVTGTYSSIFVASPMLLFLPWHYLRNRRGGLFWILVAISVVAVAGSLFATTPAASTAFLVAMLVYPAYFLVDLVRWLFLADPDYALNIVLRGQAAKV